MEPDWLIECCYDWDLHTFPFPITEAAMRTYLDSTTTGAYLCLFDQHTEENLRPVGSGGQFILEGDLNTFTDPHSHFVLAKHPQKGNLITLADLPGPGQTYQLPEEEVFTAEEVLSLFLEFHQHKRIPTSLTPRFQRRFWQTDSI